MSGRVLSTRAPNRPTHRRAGRVWMGLFVRCEPSLWACVATLLQVAKSGGPHERHEGPGGQGEGRQVLVEERLGPPEQLVEVGEQTAGVGVHQLLLVERLQTGEHGQVLLPTVNLYRSGE